MIFYDTNTTTDVSIGVQSCKFEYADSLRNFNFLGLLYLKCLSRRVVESRYAEYARESNINAVKASDRGYLPKGEPWLHENG